MELRRLKAFTTTARLLSFTKAADELGYAQSTITSQIQMLEEELGVKLFERLGKQVKLTKDGEQLYAYAGQILKLSDEAKALISSSRVPKGAVIIGTAESLCIHRLPKVFNTFRRNYPNVELHLRFDTGGDYRSLLRKNAIDLVIFLDVLCSDSDLISHVLFDERMSLIAAPNHPLAQKRQVIPQDIDGEALVLTSEGCTYRKVLENTLLQEGVKAGSIMGISSNEVIKKFVCDGWGIGFLPHIVVQQEINSRHMVELPWAGPSFSIQAQLIYHKDKWLSPALKAFINAALQMLKK